ncbi:MAG TPA: hypothetical protein VFP97_13715 [Chitinophagaceae bacterium]|nr:hypothetical protein [Chitinophagaceae bacterium]
MRQLSLLSLLAFLCLASCNDSRPGKLEDAFILSLQNNNFDLLRDYLPDEKFYRSLGDKVPQGNDEEIKKIIDAKHEELRTAWQNTYFNAAEKKIELNKLDIKDVIYYDPFPKDETNEAMIIIYEYKGTTGDDIQFIISRKSGKIVLLGIPNPTRAFSMQDKDLPALNEAKAWIELSKPAFKRNIEDLSNKLVTAAKSNNLDEFGKHLAYRGADETKLWRTAVNMNDSTERQLAAQFMQRLNKNLENCGDYKTGNFVTNRESQGLWITWPLDCGDKIVTLHYLRINDKLLLADTDVEGEK